MDSNPSSASWMSHEAGASLYLSLGFLICKMEIIVSVCRVVARIKFIHSFIKYLLNIC